MKCIACGRGLCLECGDPCCCSTINIDSQDIFSREDLDHHPKELETKHIGESAGRKRAAAQYEINPNQSCEWRGLANCGGGKYPIIGCITGLQANRHHGPIKNTSRNERGNVHLICLSCHHLWHAKNDPVYSEEEFEKLLHTPRIASPDEMLSRK